MSDENTPEELLKQGVQELENIRNTEYYPTALENALEHFKHPESSSLKQLKAVTPNLRKEFADWDRSLNLYLEASGRNQSSTAVLEFPDGHRGFVLQTFGTAVLNPEDEAVFLLLEHCYAAVYKLKLENEEREVELLVHHNPSVHSIQTVVVELKKYGDIKELYIAANDENHTEDGLTSSIVAKHIQDTTGIRTRSTNLETDDRRPSFNLLYKDGNFEILPVNPIEDDEII